MIGVSQFSRDKNDGATVRPLMGRAHVTKYARAKTVAMAMTYRTSKMRERGPARQVELLSLTVPNFVSHLRRDW
jgi:hypothetical protein